MRVVAAENSWQWSGGGRLVAAVNYKYSSCGRVGQGIVTWSWLRIGWSYAGWDGQGEGVKAMVGCRQWQFCRYGKFAKASPLLSSLRF